MGNLEIRALIELQSPGLKSFVGILEFGALGFRTVRPLEFEPSLEACKCLLDFKASGVESGDPCKRSRAYEDKTFLQ